MAQGGAERGEAASRPAEVGRKPWAAPKLSVSSIREATLLDDGGSMQEGGDFVANS